MQKKVTPYFLPFITLLLCLMAPAILWAQPPGAKVETIAGKEYYVHTVKKGETLSGIAKKYKVSLADVLNNNPGKEDRIDIGDRIKIPVTNKNRPKPNTTDNTNTTNNNLQVPPAKKTIEHKVERGETVYGISKKYKVTDTEIYELNPEAKNGISPGQILKIKTSEAVINTNTNNTANTTVTVKPAEPEILFSHTVLPQETFFSLSRKYNISVDSIKLLNNGLPDGLKAGSVIQLAGPASKMDLYKGWEANPVTIVNNNQAALNGQPDTLSATLNNLTSVFKTGKKEVYNVGIMVPFMLDKNKQAMEEQNPLGRSTLYEPTRQALDFYHGVLLALDSLKKAGLNTNLKVFDVTKDSTSYKKVFATNEFKQLDLLIGPFDWIELTAKAAKENKIPMVIPVACSNKILLDNPFAFKTITTSAVVADEASRFIINNYKDDNIILIDGKGKNDVGVLKSYKKYLNKYYFEKTGKTDSIRFMASDFLSSATITNILRADKVNVLIVPSNDFAYVSTTLSNLNKFLARSNHKQYKAVVMGTDDWIKWDNIDITHKLRCNVHVPTPTYVDYDTLNTQKVIQSFRSRYLTDPDKYALMGFDLAYFWMGGYTQYGLDFCNMIPQFDISMTQTRFAFVKMNEASGCLNRNVYILKYENFKLVPQKNE